MHQLQQMYWREMLIVREVVWGGGGAIGGSMGTMYFLLNFAVNLKLLSSIKSIFLRIMGILNNFLLLMNIGPKTSARHVVTAVLEI